MSEKKEQALDDIQAEWHVKLQQFIQDSTDKLADLEKEVKEKNEQFEQVKKQHQEDIRGLKIQTEKIQQQINEAQSLLPWQTQLLIEIDPKLYEFNNPEEFMQVLESEGKKTWIKEVKKDSDFVRCLKKVDLTTGSTEKFNLYSSLAKEIIKDGQPTTQNIFDNLKRKKAIKATGKDILQILLQQGLKLEDGENLVVYMEPIDSGGDPNIFYAFRGGDTLKLGTLYAYPDCVWLGGSQFVFSIRKLTP